MRLFRTLACMVLAALLGGLASQASAAPVKHVVIISMDGLRPDALQKARTPNFDDLWRHGSYSWQAQTVMPSVTLVSHTSMLTGVQPRKHGVTWNDHQPARGVVGVPTVFEVAKKAGFSTAMIVGKPKLKHLARPDTLDAVRTVQGRAARIFPAAAEYFRKRRPALLFIHIPDPDSIGHTVGWMTPQQIGAIERCDAPLGQFLGAVRDTGAWRDTLIIVTADHGGHGKRHGTRARVDMTIPWIAAGGGASGIGAISEPISTCDTAATALAALGLRVPEGWDGRPIYSALARREAVIAPISIPEPQLPDGLTVGIAIAAALVLLLFLPLSARRPMPLFRRRP